MDDRIRLASGETIRDVYERFCDGLGPDGHGGVPGVDSRSLDELRALIQSTGLRYRDADRITVDAAWAACVTDESDVQVDDGEVLS